MSGASEFTSRNDGVRKSHFMIPLQQRPMDGRFWTLVILLIDNIVQFLSRAKFIRRSLVIEWAGVSLFVDNSLMGKTWTFASSNRNQAFYGERDSSGIAGFTVCQRHPDKDQTQSGKGLPLQGFSQDCADEKQADEG